MAAMFNNDDDIINVCDIIARVEQLEALRTPGPIDLGDDDDNAADQDSLFAELASLEALLAELVGGGGDEQWRGDWYPAALIRDSYMREYAQQTAEDCGMIPADATWPNTCIDWDQATREFKMDYSAIELSSSTYWYR